VSGQEDKGRSSVLRCSFLRNIGSQLTGVLEHCREGEIKWWFSFFRVFSSDRIRKATKEVNVRFFIPRYYTSEFL